MRKELPWRTPARDFVLLPLIFVLTILALLIGGEILSRKIYVQDDAAEPCEFISAAGYRYIPLCSSRTKVWEGPWITQHFNECGYRTAEPCAPRPAGSLRVVVMGSSTARGALVNYAESFAARASDALSDRCGARVDFQNLGSEPPDVDRIDQRMPEALALKPSAVVMTIGPYDLIHLKDALPDPAAAPPPARFNVRDLVNTLRESRLFLVMQSYLYRDPAFQIRAFLLNGDSADYVRIPLSAAWMKRVDEFGDLLGRMSALANQNHVPIFVFYIPERAQAALQTLRSEPPGVDPLALGIALKKVAADHDVSLYDATPAFASAPDFQDLYYLTDGHPRPAGHAALADVVEQALASDPAFAHCRRSAAAKEPPAADRR